MADDSRRMILEYSMVTILAVAVVALLARKGDAQVCREIFQDLVDGRPRVERRIDWEHFQAMGIDVGATYLGLRDDTQRAGYRKAFLENFQKGFRKGHGNAQPFTHWRMHTRDAGSVIVAADAPVKGKTLLFRLATDRAKRLQGLQWQ